jgi:hypothetical protein
MSCVLGDKLIVDRIMALGQSDSFQPWTDSKHPMYGSGLIIEFPDGSARKQLPYCSTCPCSTVSSWWHLFESLFSLCSFKPPQLINPLCCVRESQVSPAACYFWSDNFSETGESGGRTDQWWAKETSGLYSGEKRRRKKMADRWA